MSDIFINELKHAVERRFFAVSHMGAIKSPVDAVRAAIVQKSRTSK
jgi:hypothetical protein